MDVPFQFEIGDEVRHRSGGDTHGPILLIVTRGMSDWAPGAQERFYFCRVLASLRYMDSRSLELVRFCEHELIPRQETHDGSSGNQNV